MPNDRWAFGFVRVDMPTTSVKCSDMKVSVVIVSWNAKAYLLRCIESVLEQTVRASHSIQIIVVDNASQDGSAEAVAERFPGVTLIVNERNYGFARANNIGIRASDGDYLCLINSDVVVRDECFARSIAYMEKHPAIGLLGPRIIDSDNRVQRSCMGYPTLWNTLCRALALDTLFPRSRVFGGHLLTYWSHDDIRPVEVINGCFWVVRRLALEQVGLLDERFFIYAEDVDWCKRFNESGWAVVYFPGAEAMHYGGASSANAPIRFNLEMQRANYQYWQKYHSRAGVAAYLVISLIHHALRVLGEIAAYPVGKSTKDSSYKIRRSIASIRWILGSKTQGRGS